MTRREVLRLAALLGVVPVTSQLGACGSSDSRLPQYEFEGEPGPETLFSHGVASGDPLVDAVVLWSRLTPATEEPLDVFWEVALDPDFGSRVGAGWTTTDAGSDYTVKIDAADLAAGTTYHYRFRALGRTSPVGTTRTAPDGPVERLRFGVVSCSNYPEGYFHAYRRLADRTDLDAIIHLGDYIYEYGAQGPVRPTDPPHEILSLEDYRRRYALYRADPDLQAAHLAFPWITVWDDHETANNAYEDGSDNHDPATEGPWVERRARAQQAYAEWMPIRFAPGGPLFRSLSFGDLVDLILLDTRIWGRDLQAIDYTALDVIRDPNRTILGFDQEAWLADRLRGSTARWKVIGQQVIFGWWKLGGAPNSEGGGTVANTDQWDGYQPCRQRVWDTIKEGGVENVVVLTGDVHSSWAMDLPDDPNDPANYDPDTGRGSLGVEIVAPGVTSGFPAVGFEGVILAQNPHVKYGDTIHRGYVILDVTPERAKASWYHFDDVRQPETVERVAATFATQSGTNHLVAEPDPV